jgi:hypothetical protein
MGSFMNESVLKLDSKAIERKLRDDFEIALAAWATSPPEAQERSRRQLDRAQKKLTDLLLDLKSPEDI